jgi:hypothetical protein
MPVAYHRKSFRTREQRQETLTGVVNSDNSTSMTQQTAPAAPEENGETVTQRRTLCIMPTFTCTAACRQCGTFSSPRASQSLPEAHVLSVIGQAAKLGYSDVVFTGGEPTMAGEMLLTAMRFAKRLGLRIRMVTNAHWASEAETADRRLGDFMACGLEALTISTGDEHARFVPLESVIHAARACASRGLPAFISVEYAVGRSLTAEALARHPEMQSIRRQFPAADIRVNAWLWSPLSAFRAGHHSEGETVNRANLEARGRCSEVLSTTTVQADGSISPCCGLGIRFLGDLKLGNVRDTSLATANRRAEADFLKRWIRAEGPERILAWASEHDPSIRWENLYAHQCHACMRVFRDAKVRSVVAAHAHEKREEIEFLETLLLPVEARPTEPDAASGAPDGSTG